MPGLLSRDGTLPRRMADELMSLAHILQSSAGYLGTVLAQAGSEPASGEPASVEPASGSQQAAGQLQAELHSAAGTPKSWCAQQAMLCLRPCSCC